MKILLLLSLLLSFGCNSDSEEKTVPVVKNQSEYSEELEGLVESNDAIQRDLAESIILQSATADSINDFRTFLIRSRRYLIVLMDNPRNEEASRELDKLVKEAKRIPIAVKDESFVMPFITMLETFVHEIMLFQGIIVEAFSYEFGFNEGTLNQIIKTKEETAADFLPRSNANGDYLGVDSFRNKNDGKVSVVTPAIELGTSKYQITFDYLVRFYSTPARAERMVKFFVGEDAEKVEDIEWKDLNVELGPDAGGFGDKPSTTEAVVLEQADTKIRIKVEYRSDKEKKFFPAFNIFKLEVKEQ